MVVGHSFGGAVALNLAAARPDLVAALVLLDPAVGLDGGWMRDIADDMFASPDYTDREEARTEKANGSWARGRRRTNWTRELDEHLIDLPGGRAGWRISIPAMMSYWSELARPIRLPQNGIPVTLVRAAKTDPPYVTDELLSGLSMLNEVPGNDIADATTSTVIEHDAVIARHRPWKGTIPPRR